MKRFNRIIIVDDNKCVLNALKFLLAKHFDDIVLLADPGMVISEIRVDRPDCILLDMNFKATINSGNEGLYWLNEIKRINKDIPVVLFTAYGDIDLAVKGIKNGATDFVIKPWDNEKLVETLLSAAGLKGKQRNPKSNTDEPRLYWGQTHAMHQLRELLEKAAPTDANILITGENGTGKEVLAREVHFLSARSSRPLTVIDMGAVSDTLFESELFGHVKGAFTGAVSHRIGKMESARGGTLFMDEIANLPMRLQSKLLVSLQSRSVVPLGANEPRPIDVRLICATNSRIDELVGRGQFREDLLYRINTICLHLPPLRERVADIEALSSAFIKHYARTYSKPATSLSPASLKLLCAYKWPGNIRELQHTIEKAVIISDKEQLEPSHLMLDTSRSVTSVSTDVVSTLAEMERSMIVKAITECDGNLSMVASKLGITRQTLYNKMKRFNL